jgi:hypothetical protein
MGLLLGGIFFGVSILAHHLRPYPSHDETVISQMGRAVFGDGPIYVLLQVATAAILTLAANTAYADFPRLSSIIAKDGFLPRQRANRGDRLVFSNGVVFLGGAAGVLLVAFGGVTNALIPLYAVGVFTSFTLSQAAMVQRHRKLRQPGWRRGVVISGAGSLATFIVLLIVAVTKFAVGAWVPIIVVPVIIALFAGVRRHYDRVGDALSITPEQATAEPINHTVVVLVGRIHRGVLKALAYGKSLRPQYLVAAYVSFDEEDQEAIEADWKNFRIDVPLEIIASPYRELVAPIEAYINELDDRYNNDTITVIIPEFVVDRWFEHALHNQSALILKGRLLFRENTVVISVPYHLRRNGQGRQI